ncbi:hypothetical protein D3C80_2047690 [compost metagenome]
MVPRTKKIRIGSGQICTRPLAASHQLIFSVLGGVTELPNFERMNIQTKKALAIIRPGTTPAMNSLPMDTFCVAP